MEEKKKKRAGRNEITRERVISSAFTELKENGWENWNARKIAKRALRCRFSGCLKIWTKSETP